MNRSFWKKFAITGVAAVAGTAILMFGACGGSDDDDGYVHTGNYCYWFPEGGEAGGCHPIGAPGHSAEAATEASCRAAFGYVIPNCSPSSIPNPQFCDFGDPVIHPITGAEEGGCQRAPDGVVMNDWCRDGEGVQLPNQAACPAYGPAVPGIICDFGFGNQVAMTAARCNANEHGVVLGQGGYYCDFGQPTQYGNGGCWFRPSTIQAGGYSVSFPGETHDGRCAPCTLATWAETCPDPDAWAELVSEIECLGSNQQNPCITTPDEPHIGQDPPGCNPLMP